MYLYPAIDLYEGRAVRLYKGDYAKMTVYSEDPAEVAKAFAAAGADHLHLVDLEGAKTGVPANLSTIQKILQTAPFFTELGGGIRKMETVEQYLADAMGGQAHITEEDGDVSVFLEFATGGVRHA